jgi:FG-GAP-like repeat/PASTA domain
VIGPVKPVAHSIVRGFNDWSGRRGTRGCALLLACIGFALALGAVGPSATSPAPSFAAAKSYATAKNPEHDPPSSGSPAIADLNGDSRPDLVAATPGWDKVSVLLNRGDGSFNPKRSYATGADPWLLQVADLNGDGKPDLVTGNSVWKRRSDTVSVLLNRGDGSFEARRDYAAGKALYSLAIGDLNGDSKPDLVTANNRSATLSVLLNRGDGSFEAKHNYATGRKPNLLAIADLNGDGRPDLAVTNALSVSVFLNRGDGSFEAKHDYATAGYDYYPSLLRLADLNGDGRPDMLFISSSPLPSLEVWLNNGDGSFQFGDDYEMCPTCSGGGGDLSGAVESVAIADLNGDGSPDVATRVVGEHHYWQPGHGTLAVLLNKGGGTFKQRSYTTGSDWHPNGTNVVVSDLNGDGRPDLATAVGRISVLVNRGDGSFQAKLKYPGIEGPLASADLNGDDKPDLVTTGKSSLHVLINTPGLCNVQGVVGMTPTAAKRELARVNCRAGKVSRASSKRVKKGRVISQKPRFGAVLRGGSKVNLVVSRGRRS